MDIVRQTAEARQKAGIGAPGEADSPVTVPDLNAPRRLEMIAADLHAAGYPDRGRKGHRRQFRSIVPRNLARVTSRW
jgi:hypothetical protein